MPTKNARGAVIYARYSSDKQQEISIDAQVRACQKFAVSNGLRVTHVYSDEALSGKGSETYKRLEYQRLLKDAASHRFDVILVYKYDRVARDLYEHASLDKYLRDLRIELIAVTQNFGASTEAKIMKALTWVTAETYIDNLAVEVRRGKKERALKAEHNGGYPPFGYDVVDRKYVINDMEAQYVRRMFQCAIDRVGFRDLIDEMDRIGMRGKRGAKIGYSQIYEILRNEKYTGTYIYSETLADTRSAQRAHIDAIRIDGAFPAIVSKDIFKEARRVMASRRQTGKKANYLCSGLVYCARCGAKMHATKSTQDGKDYYRYYCSKSCGMPSTHMENVDRIALDYVQDILDGVGSGMLTEAVNQYIQSEKAHQKDFETIKKKRISEKKSQIEGYMQKLSVIDLPRDLLSDIADRIQMLKDEIKAIECAEPPEQYSGKTIQAWLQGILDAPSNDAVKLLIQRINLDVKDKKNIEYSIESTLSSMLGKTGSGGSLHVLPDILFGKSGALCLSLE